MTKIRPYEDDYGNEKFEAGLEYEDWVCDYLMKNYGIFIGVYSSKKYQREKGESQSGYEIKHDMIMHSSRNVYIEVAEKSKATNLKWVPSGIYRNDNSWMYLIGDYKEILIFSKHQLQRIVENEKWKEQHQMKFKTISRGTSQGYTLPIQVAIDTGLCLRHIIVKEGDSNA